MARGRKTGGRKAGTPNKATADIKAVAQEYGPQAIAVLVEIVNDKAAPHASRVAAADKLLDRGYGKARQAIDLGSQGGGAHSLAFFYATNSVKQSDSTNAESLPS